MAMNMTMQKLWAQYILPFMVWAWAFFSPTFEFILIMGFLVVCDMITGIMASRREGEAIESRKLKRTVSKFAAYGIGILVSHVICVKFLSDFPGLQLTAGFIAFIELKSLDENIKRITGYSLLAAVLNKLKQKREP